MVRENCICDNRYHAKANQKCDPTLLPPQRGNPIFYNPLLFYDFS